MELKLGGDIQEKLDNDAEGKQTILVVENIKKLKLDFSLAEPDEGRVSIKHDLRVEIDITTKIGNSSYKTRIILKVIIYLHIFSLPAYLFETLRFRTKKTPY